MTNSLNLFEQDGKKPIFVSLYPSQDNSQADSYLFIYQEYLESLRDWHYCHQISQDPIAAISCLSHRFPEGLKFHSATKNLLKSFINDVPIPHLTRQEFRQLKPQLEKISEGFIPFQENLIHNGYHGFSISPLEADNLKYQENLIKNPGFLKEYHKLDRA